MPGPVARLLPDGKRLHLQHGPIDLILGAEPLAAESLVAESLVVGGPRGPEGAFRAAHARFQTVLQELVDELPLLRREVGEMPQGAVAQRMVRACLPHAPVFVTPMAAVAGAVAEEVLAAMVASGDLARAYVNNGGDIAFHLAPGARFRMAIASLTGARLGEIDVAAEAPSRGVATSGRGGRSLSMGIAEAVTVLARTAAMADVAATLIGNAVDLPGHPAVRRVPAESLQPDSDLGARPVVAGVGELSAQDSARALERGLAAARDMQARGLIEAAALFLNGQTAMTGAALQGGPLTLNHERTPAHA